MVETIWVRYGLTRMPEKRDVVSISPRTRNSKGRRLTECRHNRAESFEHDVVLDSLLLECVDNAVDELHLEALVDVGRAKVRDDLGDDLHDHLAERLAFVLEVIDDASDDLRDAGLVGEFDRGLDDLAVVPAVERHSSDEEVAEELRQDLLADVLWLHTIGGGALLDDLEDDLLHLLVGRLELAVRAIRVVSSGPQTRSIGNLPDQDDHDFTRVVVRVLRVHERDDETDRLEEGGKTFTAVLADTGPQRLEDAVEGLDTVRCGSLGESSDAQRRHRPDFLLLVLEAVRDGFDEVAEMRQDSAAHHDGDLLNDFDTGVPSLPRLLRPADGFEERQQRRDAERRSDNREGASGRVAHVLVGVVNVCASRCTAVSTEQCL